MVCASSKQMPAAHAGHPEMPDVPALVHMCPPGEAVLCSHHGRRHGGVEGRHVAHRAEVGALVHLNGAALHVPNDDGPKVKEAVPWPRRTRPLLLPTCVLSHGSGGHELVPVVTPGSPQELNTPHIWVFNATSA